MCVSESDPELIVGLLADIARAHGVDRLAQESGLSSATLEQLIAPQSHPDFSSVVSLVRALGLTLHARSR